MKALEFYSGIGGLHYALAACVPDADVTAFDINDLANRVYAHNFGRAPVAANIGSLTARRLDKYGAEAWLLSPPCQPYTRRGLQKQSADNRATSFLAVLDLLPQLKSPPRYLLVENVVGFESSDTRDALAEVLAGAGYQLQEFIVTPHQLGIPYSRPRYFALSKRGGAFVLPQRPAEAGPYDQPPSALLAAAEAEAQRRRRQTGEAAERPLEQQEQLATARPLEEFLVESPAPELEGGVLAKLPNLCYDTTQQPAGSAAGTKDRGVKRPAAGDAGGGADAYSPDEAPVAANGSSAARGAAQPSGEGAAAIAQRQGPAAAAEGAAAEDPWAAFRVPDDVIRKHGYCFDLVSPASTISNCFTKTYSQYTKGSGSLLATCNFPVLEELAEAERQRQAQRTSKGSGSGGAADCNGGGAEAAAEGDTVAAAAAAAEEEEGRGQAADLVDAKALAAALRTLGLRYFTPREIANLHSFPPGFSFPPSVTLRQRYSLLGNSLSVAVVADLLQYLFMEPEAPAAVEPAAVL